LTDDYVELQQEILEQAELYLNQDLSAQKVKSLALKCPSLFRNILIQAERHELFTDKELSPTELAAISVSLDGVGLVKFVTFAITHAYEEAEDALWADENTAKIKAAVANIKAQRLLKLMELEMPRRVNDDLSRIFFRTLSELRKHQQWRQAKNTIDITPKSNVKLS
jgi:hypothetical protein